MKITEFLQDVGRPVAYYPSLRRITGSTNATILLCQFIYWRGKESDQDGWLYKDSDEIEQETGLSYNEQKTARKNLIDAGLIEEYYARLDHQMKFRVILDAVNTSWGIAETNVPESHNVPLGNSTKQLSLNESENTTQNTTETGADFPIDWFLAHGMNVPKNHKDKAGISKLATDEFESAFGFNSLPWDVSSEWQAFKKWVAETWQTNPQVFREYAEWRKEDGKYNAMNNKQIRNNPRMFIDTGYPEFLAHKSMYRRETKNL